jgi:ATP-dependent RNA helicase RhlE
MPEPIEEHAAVKQYNDPISIAKRAKQKLYHVSRVDKNAMLEQIIRSLCKVKAVVITKTKRSADELEAYLQTRDINAMSVHSNKGKQACEAGAKAFNEDEIDILITTDMILQSLALTGIEYMLGYDLPVEAEHYLSRIGCMSEAGEAISLVSKEEETLLFLIERKMRQEIVQEELEGFIPTPESEQILTRHRTHTKKPRHKKTKSKEKEGSKEQKE